MNSTADTSRPPRRPIFCDIGPARAAPITQPSRAQEIAQPDRLSALVSGRPRGAMKLCIDGADGAGNHGRVVTEQQSAECGHDRQTAHQRGLGRRVLPGVGNPL